uniref:Uncharacterized protein n=1 Tax=Strombidium inclinatum TaxID=197538 RepID=A0A7S3IVU3_9SPIT
MLFKVDEGACSRDHTRYRRSEEDREANYEVFPVDGEEDRLCSGVALHEVELFDVFFFLLLQKLRLIFIIRQAVLSSARPSGCRISSLFFALLLLELLLHFLLELIDFLMDGFTELDLLTHGNLKLGLSIL